MRHIRTFGKATGTPSEYTGRLKAQTTEEERLWSDITSRTNTRSVPKPPARKRVPLTEKKAKAETKREARDRINRETTTRMLKEGKSVADIRDVLRISVKTMYLNLKKWGLNKETRNALRLEGQRQSDVTEHPDESRQNDEPVVIVDVTNAPTLRELVRAFLEGKVGPRPLIEAHDKEFDTRNDEDT